MLDFRTVGLEQILPTEDYVEKYGPLIRILTSERDYDYLASTAGYARASVDAYRAGRREALRSYTFDLAREFEILTTSGRHLALRDAKIAAKLHDAERALVRTLRLLRFRIFVEGLLPVPANSPKPGFVRRWLVRALSNDQPVRELLFSMNELGKLVRQ
jgi:hypothetical protein